MARRWKGYGLNNGYGWVRTGCGGLREAVSWQPIQLSMGHDDVLIRVLAAPVHPSDLNQLEDRYPLRLPMGSVPGREGVGEVVAMGSHVTQLSVGDRVIALGQGAGWWATLCVKPAGELWRIPDDMPLAWGALAAINGLTAVGLLSGVSAGQRVVQSGATSHVGQWLLQVAMQRGIEMAHWVRYPHQVAMLQARGATDVAVWGDKGFSCLADVAFDAIGGEMAGVLIRGLRDGGRYWVYGGMGRAPLSVPLSPLLFRGIQMGGFWRTQWMQTLSFTVLQGHLLSLMGCVPPPTRGCEMTALTQSWTPDTKWLLLSS